MWKYNSFDVYHFELSDKNVTYRQFIFTRFCFSYVRRTAVGA